MGDESSNAQLSDDGQSNQHHSRNTDAALLLDVFNGDVELMASHRRVQVCPRKKWIT